MPASATVDHATIVTDDFEADRRIYDAVLGAVGLVPAVDYEDPEGESDDTGTVAALGYAGPGRRPVLWLVAGAAPTVGAHVALAVTDRASVLAAYEAASAVGARVVQAPRDWEESQLAYFGAQFADGAGNLLEILHRLPPMSPDSVHPAAG